MSEGEASGRRVQTIRAGRLVPLGLVIAFVFCALCDDAIFRATPPVSDSVQNFNELIAVFQGNPLLGHWVLASDSFYFTDLPFYVLGALAFGRSPTLIYLAPLLGYGLLLLVSLLIAGRAPGSKRAAAVAVTLFLIGVPFAPGQDMLRISAFHTATVLYSLVAIAASAPALDGERLSLSRWVAFGLAVFIACASDPMADVFFLLPFLGFLLIDGINRKEAPRTYLTLAGLGVFAFWLAAQFPGLMEKMGGFKTRPSFSSLLDFHPHAILSNLSAIGAAFGILFGVSNLQAQPFSVWVSVTRVLALGWVAYSLGVHIARTRPGRPLGLARCLVVCAACLLVADALSITFAAAVTSGPGYPNAAVRYVAPAFIFLCLAAALAPGPLPARPRHRRIVAAVSAGCVVILGASLTVQAVQALRRPSGLSNPPAVAVLRELRARGLTYGVGDYYTTQLVRALSSGQVMADPVVSTASGRLSPDRFWTDTTRFDAGWRPQFVIYPPDNWFHLTREKAVATYGRPKEAITVDGVEVLIYPIGRGCCLAR